MPYSSNPKYPAQLDSAVSIPLKYANEVVYSADFNTLRDVILAIEIVLGPNGENVWKKTELYTIPANAVGSSHIQSGAILRRHVSAGAIGEDQLSSFSESKVTFGNDLAGGGHTHNGSTGGGLRLRTEDIKIHNLIPESSGLYSLGTTDTAFKQVHSSGVHVNSIHNLYNIFPHASGEASLGDAAKPIGNIHSSGASVGRIQDVKQVIPYSSGIHHLGALEKPFNILFMSGFVVNTGPSGFLEIYVDPTDFNNPFKLRQVGRGLANDIGLSGGMYSSTYLQGGVLGNPLGGGPEG